MDTQELEMRLKNSTLMQAQHIINTLFKEQLGEQNEINKVVEQRLTNLQEQIKQLSTTNHSPPTNHSIQIGDKVFTKFTNWRVKGFVIGEFMEQQGNVHHRNLVIRVDKEYYCMGPHASPFTLELFPTNTATPTMSFVTDNFTIWEGHCTKI